MTGNWRGKKKGGQKSSPSRTGGTRLRKPPSIKGRFYKSNPAVAGFEPGLPPVRGCIPPCGGNALWPLHQSPGICDCLVPNWLFMLSLVKVNMYDFSEIVFFDYWRDQLPDGVSENSVFMDDFSLFNQIRRDQ
jgi:hypothetical protein